MRTVLPMPFAFVIATLALPAFADDWSNAGGNAGRNGQSGERGPDSATTIWTTAPTSIIAWHPVAEGDRVFAVRQTGFPPEPASDRSPIVCLDLNTGAELWRTDLPFNAGEWTTWIAGVRDGRVYASRSGNGATSNALLYCLDAATGAILWHSQDTINAGPYDGVVFAPDGDPVVADFNRITRFDHATGQTVWRVNRVCTVSSSCGGAIHGDAIYVADAVVGGNAIKKFDLGTGAFAYQSSLMPGFTLQNTPMVSPDGTIYLSRTQNNPATDFFYAFDDTGSLLVERWAVPAQWTTSSEFAVHPDDDSVYMLAPGLLVTRLDPSDGTILAQAAASIVNDGATSNTTPRMAIDRDGRLYMTNGAFTNGRLYAFDEDLALLWETAFPSVNIGGTVLAANGTLIVAGTGTNMRAYRTACAIDVNGDGEGDILDFLDYLDAFGECESRPAPCAGSTGVDADYNGDTIVDVLDFLDFLNAFGDGC